MMLHFHTSSTILSYALRLLDLSVIALSAYLASKLRFNGQYAPTIYYTQLPLFACLIFTLIANKIYYPRNRSDFFQSLISTVGIWSITCTLIFLGIFFTKTGSDFSRAWLALWFLFVYAGLLIIRVLNHLCSRSLSAKRIAIIGKGPAASDLCKRIKANRSCGLLLTRHIELEDINSISNLHQEFLDEIWIALPIDYTNHLQNIIHMLNKSSASIKFIPDLFTFRLINHGASEVLGIPMLDLTTSPFVGSNLLLKSAEDLLLSICILILISPILLFTAIGVKLTSPGPIFYKQERVGLNGKIFQMLKFRSMPAETEKNGVVWGGSDSKVAHPFGAFIRKYNVDELPQFFNVLRGDMAIVGPRPERVEFIYEFADRIPNYMKKHLVKAGITGLAQVHGLRGDTDLNKRIEYDLFYIEYWSLWLDFKIITKTITQTFMPIINKIFSPSKYLN